MMNRVMRILALIMAMVIVIMAAPQVQREALAESDGMVRVKLSRLGTPTKLVFTTGCAYFINNSKSDKIPSGSTVTVTLENGKFHLQAGNIDREMGSSFTLNRKNGGVSGVRFTTPAMANVFTGDFTFYKSSGKIMTVMRTYVEDYLYGVVGFEMSNGYPLEALKTQAVAARNYVMRAKATRAAQKYDVVDGTNDQVYKGYNASYTNVIKAVDETRGQMLYYGSALAGCFYGSSNGGQTESTKNAWGGNLPYSVVKDDIYDLESGATHKSVTFPKDLAGYEMKPKLRNAIIEGISDIIEEKGCSAADEDITLDRIVSIVPQNPKYAAPSRLYKELLFTVKATTVDANGEKVSGKATAVIPTYDNFEDWFKLAINSSDNEVIWVDETEDDITVTFRRWGHGIGMSQRGAKVMAEDYSMGHDAILDFYYPGTEIRTVNLVDTTGDQLDGGEPDPGEGEPIGTAVVTLQDETGTVNMRQEANKNSPVVMRLNHGTIVNVYGFTGKWTKVSFEENAGFVKSEYLSIPEDLQPTPEPSVEPTATPAPTEAPTVTPEPTATVKPTPEPDEDAVYAKIKLSNKNSKLKIRKKATTSSKVVRLIKHGKTVKVLAIKGSWAKIETANGKKGFVMKKYLKRIKNPGAAWLYEDEEELFEGYIPEELR